jgi:hypothetical protein
LLGCGISYSYDKNLEHKMSIFENTVYVEQLKNLKYKTREDTQIKFDNISFCAFVWKRNVGNGGKLKLQKYLLKHVSSYIPTDHLHSTTNAMFCKYVLQKKNPTL